MEKAVMLMVVGLLFLFLEQKHQVDGHAVDTAHTQIMQAVRARHPQRFSYCLRREPTVPGQRHGFLRFDGEVGSTHGIPHAQLLYNTDHAADYGPYFVELVGVSVGGTALAGVDAGTFHRDAATGKGGTVLDVGTTGLVLVRAAYEALEQAVLEHMRPIGLPHVSRPGYGFCLCGATAALWFRMPVVTLHLREPGAELRIPPARLFVPIDHDACMTLLPGDTTVLGALAQIDTRFTFDLSSGVVFFARENCELDTGRS
ncbi:hypothetical protein QOZ80_1BG0063890 [Eleusine coracana subsp. coracana]|nr:hypothetical protein QOZ80_1BG0063890 [Eleusine coracana subsp. coracana]